MAEVEDKTVAKTLVELQAEAPVNSLLDTLWKVVAKAKADTLSCVEAKAPVKTEGGTVAQVQAYTIVNTPL